MGFFFLSPSSSLSLGELEASGAVQVSGLVMLPGPQPWPVYWGFLLHLLREREGILADPLPSESPLGSVGAFVFFPGSSALAVGSTST